MNVVGMIDCGIEIDLVMVLEVIEKMKYYLKFIFQELEDVKLKVYC